MTQNNIKSNPQLSADYSQVIKITKCAVSIKISIFLSVIPPIRMNMVDRLDSEMLIIAISGECYDCLHWRYLSVL